MHRDRNTLHTILRWLWRVLALGACGTAVVTLFLLLLPTFTEKVIERQLRRHGLEGVRLDVIAVSPSRTVIGPITIGHGEDALTIETVFVHYKLMQVVRRRHLKEVVISGLNAEVRRTNDGWTVAGLHRLLSAPPSSNRRQPLTLPFGVDRMRLRASRIVVRSDSDSLPLTARGTVSLASFPTLQGSLELQAADQRVRAGIQLDAADGSGTVQTDTDPLDIGQWMDRVSLVGGKLPSAMPYLSGTASLSATVTLSDWELKDVRVAADVPAVTVITDEATAVFRDLAASATLDAELAIDDLEVSATADKVRYGKLTTEAFALSGQTAKKRMQLTATNVPVAWGPITRVKTDITASFSLARPLHSRATVTATVVGAHLYSQELPDLTVSLSGTPMDTDVDFSLDSSGAQVPYGLVRASVRGILSRHDALRIQAQGKLVMDPGGTTDALGFVQLDGPNVSLPFSLSYKHTADPVWSCSVELPKSTGPLTIQTPSHGNGHMLVGATLDLEGNLGECSATIACDVSDCSWELDDNVLACETASLTATSESLSFKQLSGACLEPFLNRLDVTGSIKVAKGRFANGSGSKAEGISVELPFHWRAGAGFAGPARSADETTSPGYIGFDSLRTYGIDCKQGTIGVTWENDVCVLDGACEAPELQTSLRFRGTVALPPDVQLVGTYQVTPITLKASDTWYRRLVNVPDLTFAGTVKAEGDLRLTPQAQSIRGNLELKNLDISLAENDTAMAGLSGVIAFEALPNLKTQPHQRLTFASASVAGIPVQGGSITYQLESKDLFFLEQCALAWCGGMLRTHATRFNLRKPDFELVLYAEDIQLQQVLGLMKNFNGTAEGTLYGRIPFAIKDWRISYDQGFLYSVPGKTGALKVKEAGLLTATVPPGHPNYARLKQAEKALQDFRFDVFKLDFGGKGTSDTRLSMHLEGRSRANENLPPVILDVNVNGALQEYINMGLQFGRFRMGY
ncbi:MAG: YdbH domain-containing protein [Candidatus Pacebacteria bacterium]|nr:YdbH domain-containing protein [Candidatus Paceibacterota bacterium]